MKDINTMKLSSEISPPPQKKDLQRRSDRLASDSVFQLRQLIAGRRHHRALDAERLVEQPNGHCRKNGGQNRRHTPAKPIRLG